MAEDKTHFQCDLPGEARVPELYPQRGEYRIHDSSIKPASASPIAKEEASAKDGLEKGQQEVVQKASKVRDDGSFEQDVTTASRWLTLSPCLHRGDEVLDRAAPAPAPALASSSASASASSWLMLTSGTFREGHLLDAAADEVAHLKLTVVAPTELTERDSTYLNEVFVDCVKNGHDESLIPRLDITEKSRQTEATTGSQCFTKA